MSADSAHGARRRQPRIVDPRFWLERIEETIFIGLMVLSYAVILVVTVWSVIR